MADNAKAPDQGNEQDPIHNLKSEMNRKIANLEESNQKLLSTLESIKTAVAPKQAPAAPKKELSDLLYEDPNAFVETVVNAAVTKSAEATNKQQQMEYRKNNVITQLYNDYPELGDANDPLTKKTLEIYQSLPEDERQSPMAYKLAAREAATELGVAPKSKRPKQDVDDFTGVGTGGGGRTSRKKQEAEQDQAILEVAAAFGLDTNDEKAKDRLLGRKKRNFNRYE